MTPAQDERFLLLVQSVAHIHRRLAYNLERQSTFRHFISSKNYNVITSKFAQQLKVLKEVKFYQSKRMNLNFWRIRCEHKFIENWKPRCTNGVNAQLTWSVSYSLQFYVEWKLTERSKHQ